VKTTPDATLNGSTAALEALSLELCDAADAREHLHKVHANCEDAHLDEQMQAAAAEDAAWGRRVLRAYRAAILALRAPGATLAPPFDAEEIARHLEVERRYVLRLEVGALRLTAGAIRDLIPEGAAS
jgi:hypothetical protein